MTGKKNGRGSIWWWAIIAVIIVKIETRSILLFDLICWLHLSSFTLLFSRAFNHIYLPLKLLITKTYLPLQFLLWLWMFLLFFLHVSRLLNMSWWFYLLRLFWYSLWYSNRIISFLLLRWFWYSVWFWQFEARALNLFWILFLFFIALKKRVNQIFHSWTLYHLISIFRLIKII